MREGGGSNRGGGVAGVDPRGGHGIGKLHISLVFDCPWYSII